MLRHSPNVSYIDYQPDTVDAVNRELETIAPRSDVLVVTATYDRNVGDDSRPFLLGLKRFGKPVVLLTNNPYPLVVTPEMETVVVSHSLMREGLLRASEFIYRQARR